MDNIQEKIKKLETEIDINQLNYDLNIKLAKLYEEAHDFVKASERYAFIGQFAKNKDYFINKTTICVYMAGKKLNKALEAVSYISSPVNVFPEYWNFYLDKDGKLNFKNELFIFKFLQMKNDLYNQFVCIYNQGYGGSKFNLAKLLNDSKKGDMHYNVKCEIINSKLSKYDYLSEHNSIVCIASTKCNQKIFFEFPKKIKSEIQIIKKDKVFNPYEFQYFRIGDTVKVSSHDEIVIGKPIKLGHSSNRKKLVLDIFIDTLSFKYLKENSLKDIKEIYSFFNKGIIFNENYSIGEYTRPVVSGMRSGCYTYRHGMFNDKVNTKIPKKYKLIAERLREYGYNTAEFSGDTGQPSGDLFRGMNRVVIQNGHDYRAPEIIEDVIDHLESFKECDNYVRVSLLDIHRSIEESVNRNIVTQISLPIEDRFEKGNGSNSVFQKSTKEKREEYRNIVRKVDRNLSLLFKYILENYDENDFIITLSSDHGAMLLDDDEFLLKDFHTNTAFMVRGGNILNKGIYSEEMTSSVDLYDTIIFFSGESKLENENIDSNLPKIFGGDKRSVVISESLYKGQSYKICIRNQKYEYRLETDKVATYDGLINLDNFKSYILDRKKHIQVKDKNLEEYFFDIVIKHCKNIKH